MVERAESNEYEVTYLVIEKMKVPAASIKDAEVAAKKLLNYQYMTLPSKMRPFIHSVRKV